MANATDIITYIGIPLAVLGVLPILYTFGVVIVNQRRIRAALIRHGHKPITSSKQQDGFTLRSSPMTTLIEVELPKFAIAPLDRHDEQYWMLTKKTSDDAADKEYDQLIERAESTLSTVEEGRVHGHLRGGSWRAFHWKKLIVGKKLYRLQYEDELREPPAEIDFPDLINFLLDWGAQLDPMGWEKLRSGGLWTPAGTVLLKYPHDEEDITKKYHHDWILRTVMPDESDGILTVCMQWPHTYHDVAASRGSSSLPPGWGRLKQFEPPSMVEDVDDDSKGQKLAARVEELRKLHKHAIDSNGVRFKAESGLVTQVYWEKDSVETNFVSMLTHLSKLPLSQSWFTTGVSALLLSKPGSSSSGNLWGFEFPSDIATFARKDTMPVGVLVLLGFVPDTKAPQWTTESSGGTSAQINMAKRHQLQFQARLEAERLEATMPAEQARVARMNREANERRSQHEDMVQLAAARQDRENRRFKDAIASVRLSNKAVADSCLEYLAEGGEIGKDWTLYDVVEATLYLLVVDQGEDEKSEGLRILKVLDEWMTWTNNGGLRKEQFHWLEGNKTSFCLATCLVAIVQEGVLSSKGKGKASLDMLECLKMWRKVRLG